MTLFTGDGTLNEVEMSNRVPQEGHRRGEAWINKDDEFSASDPDLDPLPTSPWKRQGCHGWAPAHAAADVGEGNRKLPVRLALWAPPGHERSLHH